VTQIEPSTHEAYVAGLRKGRRQGREQGFRDAMRAITRANTDFHDRDFLRCAIAWWELKGEAPLDEDERGSELWDSDA